MKSTEDIILERLDRIERHLLAANTRQPTKIAYTPTEAAEVLGISERYLKKLRSNGEIKAAAVGGGTKRSGRVIYSRKNIEDFLAQHADAAVQ